MKLWQVPVYVEEEDQEILTDPAVESVRYIYGGLYIFRSTERERRSRSCLWPDMSSR